MQPAKEARSAAVETILSVFLAAIPAEGSGGGGGGAEGDNESAAHCWRWIAGHGFGNVAGRRMKGRAHDYV